MNALCRLINNSNNVLGLIFFAVMLALLNLPLLKRWILRIDDLLPATRGNGGVVASGIPSLCTPYLVPPAAGCRSFPALIQRARGAKASAENWLCGCLRHGKPPRLNVGIVGGAGSRALRALRYSAWAHGHIGAGEHKEAVSGWKMVSCRHDQSWDRGSKKRYGGSSRPCIL